MLLVVSFVILTVALPRLTTEANTSVPIQILEILPSTQADNAPLELRPSNLSEFTGSEFTIEIWTNAPPDQAISAVRVSLNFDPDFMQVVDAFPKIPDVQIIPDTSSLDSIVANTVDMVFGEINLIAAASVKPYPSGSFRIASIVFGGLRDNRGQSGSKVEFDFSQIRNTSASLNSEIIEGIHQGAEIELVGVAFSGSVALQQRTKDRVGWAIPVTAKLYSPGAKVEGSNPDAPLYECSATTQRDGDLARFDCIAPGFEPGTYDITIESSYTLTNLIRGVTIDAPGTVIHLSHMLGGFENVCDHVRIPGPLPVVDLGTFFEGDSNGDGIVDILDFTLLAASYLRFEGDKAYDVRTDFNRTGQVEQMDLELLTSSFLKKSPVDLMPPDDAA
ncbi:MAG: hypothetical protein IIC84_03670 [Chloroflexi bacterium]|nr:hypothetical protein [Chloroflexota bacterium]